MYLDLKYPNLVCIVKLSTAKNIEEFVETCNHFKEDIDYYYDEANYFDAKSLISVINCGTGIHKVVFHSEDIQQQNKFAESISQFIDIKGEM